MSEADADLSESQESLDSSQFRKHRYDDDDDEDEQEPGDEDRKLVVESLRRTKTIRPSNSVRGADPGSDGEAYGAETEPQDEGAADGAADAANQETRG